MSIVLDSEHREKMIERLTNEQKEYIQLHLKKGYRTVFANKLAKAKGVYIYQDAQLEEIEKILDEWILVDFIDHGKRSENVRCECGQTLRYQYIAEYIPTKERKSFSKDHLELHTGIDAKIVKEIKAGFDEINFERDEILIKLEQEWTLDQHLRLYDTNLEEIKPQLPQDIQDHLRLKLPLLDRQLSKLQLIIRTIREERIEQIRQEHDQKMLTEIRRQQNNDYVAQTSIFEWEDSEELENDIELPTELSMMAKDTIIEQLKSGMVSARLISEHLLYHSLVRKARYITEKPKIYADVCFFLDDQVKKGNVEYLDGDLVNRNYRWIG